MRLDYFPVLKVKREGLPTECLIVLPLVALVLSLAVPVLVVEPVPHKLQIVLHRVDK